MFFSARIFFSAFLEIGSDIARRNGDIENTAITAVMSLLHCGIMLSSHGRRICVEMSVIAMRIIA